MVDGIISKNKSIIIALVVTAFVALGFIQVTYQGQMKQALENQGVAIEAIDEGRRQADARGNISADLTFEAISSIKELQANVTSQDNLRGQQFVKYLEAESEDQDEELDDLRNITLAIVDYLNITIPNETRVDHIMFENGVISFDNGTKVGIGDIFG